MTQNSIAFAPKYRRQVIYKDIKADVGQILGTLCRRKGIEIIEAECCSDHVHMLVRIPPKYSVSEIVGYLKGKSSFLMALYPEAVELERLGDIQHWYAKNSAEANAELGDEMVRRSLEDLKKRIV